VKNKPVASEAVSPALRPYLYFTAAVTGAAIMIVEILGAKMLAPYVGTSHFVWTAQIAVTLLALALGYYIGGRLVDRSPDLKRLYWAILWAAVYLCLAVLVIEPVAYWCLRFRLALGSLLASAFLFLIPLALLAMAGPFIVRMLSASVAGVGGNMGRLTAISTLGSVIGTALIGYVLIPLAPNSVTMYGTAGALVLVALGYIAPRRKDALPSAIGASALVIALAALGIWREQKPRFSRVEELARSNSEFGLLQVIQDKTSSRRYYMNDYLWQNTYDTQEKKSVSMFTYMLYGLANAYTPRITNVLCIGLGVGIVPMEFARTGAKVDVVEINPAVVPLATKFFDLEPARLNIIYGDGRHFLNECNRKYDTISLDAFLGDSSPSHLMSREAFASMKRVLNADGTLVINTFANLERGDDFFAASLSKTLASVFRSVRIHSRRQGGNTMFVASDRADLAPVREFDFARVHSSMVSSVQEAFEGLRETDPARGIVLTDDFNPVEFHDARNREGLRRNLAMEVRNL
jgi:spermidine synthase